MFFFVLAVVFSPPIACSFTCLLVCLFVGVMDCTWPECVHVCPMEALVGVLLFFLWGG